MKFVKSLFIGFVLLFIFEGCSIPFRSVINEREFYSILDKKHYLDISEYSFREYKWSKNSMALEEIYIKGLGDYFFKEQYDRAEVIFESALKIYKKDARIYTRLAECYARTGELNRALSILNNGANEIFGFDAHPGIVRYRNELNDKIKQSRQLAAQKKRNVFIRILTYPRKLIPF